MKSSFKAKINCAQLGLKYIGTGRGFETAILVGLAAFSGTFLGLKLVPIK